MFLVFLQDLHGRSAVPNPTLFADKVFHTFSYLAHFVPAKYRKDALWDWVLSKGSLKAHWYFQQPASIEYTSRYAFAPNVRASIFGFG